MSAPKLGEYVDTRQANRRERIVHDQKFPPDFKVARYRDAFNAIRAALVSHHDVGNQLVAKAEAIAARPATTGFQRVTKRCCVEAIGAFGEAWLGLLPADVARSLIHTTGFVVPTEGVEITVHPAVLLHRTLPDGRTEAGALQVVFRKEAALQKTGGQASAEILRRALVAAGHDDIVPSLCVVIDVFSGEAFTAPLRSGRITADIESACREIASRWPLLERRKAG